MSDVKSTVHQDRENKASDNEAWFSPLVTETVQHNFYVDDCVKSVPDKTEAIQLTSLH